jgi:hypothetical protein
VGHLLLNKYLDNGGIHKGREISKHGHTRSNYLPLLTYLISKYGIGTAPAQIGGRSILALNIVPSQLVGFHDQTGSRSAN